jgi:hypothetical protein
MQRGCSSFDSLQEDIFITSNNYQKLIDILLYNLLSSFAVIMLKSHQKVLPALPAASDPLSIEIYNDHHITPKNRNLLVSYLTASLDPNSKIKALVVGGRCGLVP